MLSIIYHYTVFHKSVVPNFRNNFTDC